MILSHTVTLLTFVLDEAVVDEKVTQVYINGVYQEKSTYSIDSDLVTLRFGSGNAPPNNSTVEVISFKTITSTDGTLTATTFLGDLNGTINTATTATTQSAGNNSTKISTTAYTDAKVADAINNGTTAIAPSQNAVFDALALKANIAGPTFTGTPAAPTASAGTNTTQLATTAFVTTGIANIVDSAPGTLNTLNELAAALGDDVNFSTTVTNSIATKAPLASPTFTGNATFSGKSDITTSVSGFASTITNNKDDSQGLLVRTSDNDGGEYILDLQSSSSATGTNYASKFKVAKGGDATFSGNVSLADTKYIQLNNTSTDWQLRADNAGKFIIQTSGGSEFFKIRNNGEVAFGNGTAFNQFFNVRSSSTSQSLINIGTSDNSETLNVGVLGSAGYVMMENAAALNIGTGGVNRLTISSGGVSTFQLSALTNPSGVDANTGVIVKNNGWSGITLLSSAATGSFLTFGDADAGFRGRIQYLHGSTDAMVFETAAAERMRISSTGALTITASANSTGNPRAIGFGGNSIGTNPLIYYDNAGNLVIDSTNSGKVYLNGDTTGDVNIAQGGGITYVGKTSNGGTQQQLYLAGYPLQSGSSFFGSYGFLTFAATTNYTGSARRYALTNAYAANKFAILQGGSSAANVGLGAGGSALTGTNPVFIIDGLGEISGDFNDTSDISLKKDIESLGDTTELVKKLNPVSFYWNEEQDKGENKNIGFIAQQVEEVVPELVKGDEGGKSINVTGLVSLLTKTVQEQQTIIEDLKSRIETLEG